MRHASMVRWVLLGGVAAGGIGLTLAGYGPSALGRLVRSPAVAMRGPRVALEPPRIEEPPSPSRPALVHPIPEASFKVPTEPRRLFGAERDGKRPRECRR